eukprot:TRINITY_DN824_c0_g2_i1.p1 TRINITY_DN824_c0_g2~~TRINITY_DN824_c0_g2_i1.p1  ORF type:complete len:524 (+),score=73.10 TRINITY_DN824_c0_g2_i1:420-1991(+)
MLSHWICITCYSTHGEANDNEVSWFFLYIFFSFLGIKKKRKKKNPPCNPLNDAMSMSSAQVVRDPTDGSPQYPGRRFTAVLANPAYSFLTRVFFHRQVYKVSSKNSISRKPRLMVSTHNWICQLTEKGGIERVIQIEHIARVRLQTKPEKGPEILIMMNHSMTTDPDMHFVLLSSAKDVPSNLTPPEVCEILKYLVWASTERLIQIDYLPPKADITEGTRKKKPPKYERPTEKLRKWKDSPEASTSPYRSGLKETFRKNYVPWSGTDKVNVEIHKAPNESTGITLSPAMRVSNVDPQCVVFGAVGRSVVGWYLTHINDSEVRDIQSAGSVSMGATDLVYTFSRNPLDHEEPDIPQQPLEESVSQHIPEPVKPDLTTVSQQAGSGDITEELVAESEDQPAGTDAVTNDDGGRSTAQWQQMMFQQMMLMQQQQMQRQQQQPVKVNLKLNFVQVPVNGTPSRVQELEDEASSYFSTPKRSSPNPLPARHYPVPMPRAHAIPMFQTPPLNAPVFFSQSTASPAYAIM